MSCCILSLLIDGSRFDGLPCTYMDFINQSEAVHSASDIHSVTPNVIEGLVTTYNSSYGRAMVDACSVNEVKRYDAFSVKHRA